MKIKKSLTIGMTLIILVLFYSCKETPSEKLENEMEAHTESLENRSENMENATDYVAEGFDDIEKAIENFKNALETVDNSKDRQAIRERINKILDDVELQKRDN